MSDEKFRDLLESEYNWPDYYEFKFIAKAQVIPEILEKLQGFTISQNPSSKGSYISVTARKLIHSTEEVINIYKLIGSIPGVMSL